MGSAQAGKWIFGSIIYFMLSFIVCYSMVRVGIDYSVETTGISSEMVTGSVSSHCYGLTYNTCAEISENNPLINGTACNDFKGCSYWWFGSPCSGTLFNTCTDFEYNESLCVASGCSWAEDGVTENFYTDEDRLIEEMTSANPFRQYSALRSTIRMMTGFRGNASVPTGFGFIGFFFLTLMPLCMLLFGIYSAIRG